METSGQMPGAESVVEAVEHGFLCLGDELRCRTVFCIVNVALCETEYESDWMRRSEDVHGGLGEARSYGYDPIGFALGSEPGDEPKEIVHDLIVLILDNLFKAAVRVEWEFFLHLLPSD